MSLTVTDKLKARFWNKVKRQPGCWNFLGRIDKWGYGRFKIKVARKLAHRIAWEITFGPIPENMLVLHTCDNPRCVKPSHLFLGTHKSNAEDRNSKKRQAYGEKNGFSKLTEEQALTILRWKKSDEITLKELAASFNISIAQVYLIRRGGSWKHLQ